MPHHNSVFHDLLKRVPWSVFEDGVSRHGSDKHVRRLTTKEQFIALLYGQLSGASSLREIVDGLESHGARLYHLGARPAKRSTLSDANAQRPSDVFSDLFTGMVGRMQRGLRRKVADATYLIDATSLPLSGTGSAWAYFSSKPCGVKAHVIYDADGEHPIYAAMMDRLDRAARVPPADGSVARDLLLRPVQKDTDSVRRIGTRRATRRSREAPARWPA